MSSPLVPSPNDPPGLTSRQLAKAQRLQSDTQLDLFRYQLGARLRSEMDRADSEAIADAVRVALQEELSLLSDMLARAGTSQTALELLSRKLEILSSANNRRLARRFGG
jgi:hypothetical protein